MKQPQRGFSLFIPLVVVAIIGVIGFIGWRVVQRTLSADDSFQPRSADQDVDVLWVYNGSIWEARGEPPNCPDPLTVKSPTDIKKATSVLYPGQNRGGNYKPHGGLRFDGLENNAITVTAPMKMYLVEGSRYIEQGETQYLLVFQNPCGLIFRFDHLLTLSEPMQKAAEMFPAPKVDDSRTTVLRTPVTIQADELIATAVGFKNTKNVGFDFGVYDLRTQNLASKNPTFVAAHQADTPQAFYAVCWVNMLKGGDAQVALSLPGGDQLAGKTSDYC